MLVQNAPLQLFGEMDRLDRIREANYKALEMALVRIEQQYEEEVEKLMREEKEKIRVCSFCVSSCNSTNTDSRMIANNQ